MIKLLTTLRILDSDATLSLTSIVLMVAVAKFAFAPLQMETLVALLGALASYQSKKIIRAKSANDEHAEALAELSTTVQAMKTEVQIISNRTNPVNAARR